MSNVYLPGMNINNIYGNYGLDNNNNNSINNNMYPNYYVGSGVNDGINNNNMFDMPDNSSLGQQFNQYLQSLVKNPPSWLKPYIRGANTEASVWGDPHFDKGDYAHGGKQMFEFQGKAGHTYDLLSDDGLQFNGTFQKYSNHANTIKNTSLTVSNTVDGSKSTITFNKDGKAEINGHAMKNGQTINLADGGTAIYKNGTLIVKTGNGYTITEKAEHGYVDADVKTGSLGMDNPGGLLAAVLTDNTQEEQDIAKNPEKYEKEFDVNA